jgi:hypothetical protein
MFKIMICHFVFFKSKRIQEYVFNIHYRFPYLKSEASFSCYTLEIYVVSQWIRTAYARLIRSHALQFRVYIFDIT